MVGCGSGFGKREKSLRVCGLGSFLAPDFYGRSVDLLCFF